MLILKHARRAVLLSLVALGGTAAAQGTPGTDMNDPNQVPPTTDTTTTDTTTPDTTPQDPAPMDSPSMESDTTVVTPPPPPPVVINNDNSPTYNDSDPSYVTPTTQDTDYSATEDQTTLERYGIAVALGGGVEGFTDDTARTMTNDGGSWNLRVALGTRSPIGFEAAYIGSAQSIDALGLDNDAILVGNGVEGKVRVNLLDAAVQPFAFGGVGWRRYDLTRSDFNTSAISESDNVLEVPLGAGIATKWQGFMFDARAEYRFATEENLMPSLTDEGGDASLHRWGINANVGIAF